MMHTLQIFCENKIVSGIQVKYFAKYLPQQRFNVYDMIEPPKIFLKSHV